MIDAEQYGSFSVWQDGEKVAGGSGPLEMVRREAAHYAAVYRQDGLVKVFIRKLKPRKSND